MFESKLLDALSRVHPAVPVVIFVPAIVLLTAWALQSVSVPVMLGLAAAGYALWTLFEYWLHRVVFHFEPEDGLGARLHWIIHGVHHDHPNDPLRLVMPPAVSVPLAALVFGAIYLLFGPRLRARDRSGVLRRVPDLRHDPLLPAPLPVRRDGLGGCCASGTCATTSRTTRGASGSARPIGTRCSEPPRAPGEPGPAIVTLSRSVPPAGGSRLERSAEQAQRSRDRDQMSQKGR